jgi:hypothetical protein
VSAEYMEVPSTDPTEHGDGGRDQAAGRLARCRDGSHAGGGDDLVEKDRRSGSRASGSPPRSP